MERVKCTAYRVPLPCPCDEPPGAEPAPPGPAGPLGSFPISFGLLGLVFLDFFSFFEALGLPGLLLPGLFGGCALLGLFGLLGSLASGLPELFWLSGYCGFFTCDMAAGSVACRFGVESPAIPRPHINVIAIDQRILCIWIVSPLTQSTVLEKQFHREFSVRIDSKF